MKKSQTKRNRLLPWYIGMVVVGLVVILTGYKMLTSDCQQSVFFDVGILAVIPIVYLGLMYLTFISQE